MARIRRTLALSCVVFCLLILGNGCGPRHINVHYVIPNGFRGAILVYTDQADGISLSYKDGVYICIIPECGILKIKEHGPFDSWHSVTVAFANGQIIPVANEPERLLTDQVAFWSGGTRSSTRSPSFNYDFVGTPAEHIVFRNETATGDVLPGRVIGNLGGE